MVTEETLHDLYMSARRSIAQVVSRIVPPREIEDIVQETYVRICQIDKNNNIKQPRSYLLKIARNLAFDHIKRADVKLIDSADEQPELLDSEIDTDDDEIYQQVASSKEFSQFCEAVRLLPVQCRKVFVLKKVYGYTQREIAQQLDLSESTVEKHIALGIKRCTYFMMQMSQGKMNKDGEYPGVKLARSGGGIG